MAEHTGEFKESNMLYIYDNLATVSLWACFDFSM